MVTFSRIILYWLLVLWSFTVFFISRRGKNVGIWTSIGRHNAKTDHGRVAEGLQHLCGIWVGLWWLRCAKLSACHFPIELDGHRLIQFNTRCGESLPALIWYFFGSFMFCPNGKRVISIEVSAPHIHMIRNGTAHACTDELGAGKKTVITLGILDDGCFEQLLLYFLTYCP